MNNLSAAFDIGSKFFGEGSTNPLAGNDLTGVAKVVSMFLNIAFVLAGLILLFFFILGGIGLIGSAGAENPQKTEQSKKTITSAVIGFVVVFASYWIVKLVGQLLGIENLI
jgi:succinate dehydrogenase/fumarate reductase cytochrome b subunit